jgi:putative ABC transport system permease protein
MLAINLRLALRNIFRNKLYDNAQLFRVEETNFWNQEAPQKSFFSFLMKDDEQRNEILTPLSFAVELKNNLPEVENTVRLHVFYPVIRVGDKSFKEDKDNFTYADKDFFKVFNFPLIYGSADNVLSNPNEGVISERLAKKYFGNIDVVGKVLNLDLYGKEALVKITGVAKNFPPNSSFQFDMVLPIDETSPNYIKLFKDHSFNDPLIIKLRKGTDEASFRKKFDAYSQMYYQAYYKSTIDYFNKKNPDLKKTGFHVYLRPFAEAHYNQSEGWGHYTNVKNIYELVSLAVIILIIACLNYILLTLTSALARSQDVGVRKTIGAGRMQIVMQYYTETQLLAFISVIVGLILAVTFLPFFNSLIGADLQFGYFSFTQVVISLVVLAFVLGIVAGIYPSLTMSGLKPLSIMRSFSAYRLNPVLSKFLVVVQFAICVVLIISALVINKQMRFINQASLGFDKDQVLVLQSPYYDDQKNLSLQTQLSHFVAIEAYLQDITATNFSFGEHSSRGFKLEGTDQQVEALNGDYNYFKFNKIPIIKGRDFSQSIAGDSAQLNIPESETTPGNSIVGHAVVVNQILYNMLGKPPFEVVNKTLGAVIIGVCKDYNTDDLTKAIGPVYHTINAEQNGNYWIRIKAGQNIPKAMENIRENWNKMTGGMPFVYSFLDQDVAKNYEAYQRWMGTITTSCILAIIIACLGLFGLSGLTTINRTKEIGIRKVLGASVTNLFLLINRGTFILAIGSFVIAAPLALYFVHQWLENFAYRITPDWLLFTIAGIISIATAIIAVSYHTLKAARTNPVKSLRSE